MQHFDLLVGALDQVDDVGLSSQRRPGLAMPTLLGMPNNIRIAGMKWSAHTAGIGPGPP
jgi:hypothetical protein